MSTWSLTSRQNKAYLSDSRLVNIYKPFTHKMVAKTSWHTYATKWRHCHPMYSMHHCECVSAVQKHHLLLFAFLSSRPILVMLAQFCAILLFLWTSVSAWILALVFQLYERNKLKWKWSLQRGRFCARYLASYIPRSSEDRSSWMFFIQVVRGRPGGRLHSGKT